MRKGTVVLISVIAITGIALTIVWPYLKMGFASSAHYTEKDKPEYAYYTPELLKKMPRISDDYEFRYTNISGPQALVYGVQFNGTTDTTKLREYLIQAGYKLQKHCDLDAECWISERSKKDIVTLNKSTQLRVVGVDIYRMPNKDTESDFFNN